MLRSAANTALRRAERPVRATPVFARAFASSSHDSQKNLMYTAVPKSDFGQYKEYSVIFTNRALNLMSDPFQKVMRDLNQLLKVTYNADKVAIIPGCVSVQSENVSRVPVAHQPLFLPQFGHLWHGVCCSSICYQ